MLNGIDVSVWQGQIDWSKVHASGYYFAGIKASEATYFHDPQFDRNWVSSKVQGVRRIAYHFFHADIDGGAQCDYFHDIVHNAGGFNPGDCAMLDIEITNGISPQQLIENAELFVERFLLTTQCGIYIYTGSWFYDGVLGSPKSSILAHCPLWNATYGPHPIGVSNWSGGPAIWQWTSNKLIPGIVGAVDADYFLGTPEQYDTLAKYGGRK